MTRRLRALYRVGPQAWRETMLGAVGMGLALFITGSVTRMVLGDVSPWPMAPLGATALLLFFVPASPLAQPWSVIGGNTLSALIGMSIHLGLSSTPANAGLAAAAAAAAMFALRCMHPPSVAVALTAALGGPAIKHLGLGLVVLRVACDSAAMVLMATVFNRFMGRRYPHPPAQPEPAMPLPLPGGLDREDLQAALASFGEPLDIDGDDLEQVLVRAGQNARQRRLGR